MNKIFRKEWELYQRDLACMSFRGVKPKPREKGFDGKVNIGEIRIFADMNRPFVALLLKDEGLFGYRIIPVSPFTVPASAREMLVGERVYQLWNDCTAARKFVERSWVVDRLDERDLEEIEKALCEVPVGAVSTDEIVAAYERAFRVTGGNFCFMQTERKHVAWWRKRKTWGLAAMLMICCGALVCFIDKNISGTARSPVYQIELARAVAPEAELQECNYAEVESAPECAPSAVDIEIDVDMPETLAPAQPHEPRRCANAAVPKAVEGCPRERVIRVGSSNPGADVTRCGAAPRRSEAAAPRRSRAAAPHFRLTENAGEKYATVGENQFMDPTEAPLSTFGLDVDTTSYALMRSSLADYRQLPKAQSIRIEEFVNYFKYNYPEPKGGDPIAVDCELAPCPWNAHNRLLRIGVQAKTVDEAKLPPSNLTFLIDVSGSMAGDYRLGLVQKALKLLVGKLREQDHVAIVTYANRTRVRLGAVSGREKRKITKVIDSLFADGGTAGGAGLELAYREAKKNFNNKANNRVILVTDGDFNIGPSSPEELEELIAEKRKSGIFLSVLGVGRGNYLDANMKKLATSGNGNYAYLDSLLEAKKVLLNEFGGTMVTVAKDVKIQVEFNPAQVDRYRLLGYENRKLAARDFNDDRKDAGEVGSGHAMTAFYEIVPANSGETEVDRLKYQPNEKKRPADASEELCTVKMRWKAPEGSVSKRRDMPLKAAEITRKEPSEDFRFASAVAEYALLLKRSESRGTSSFKDVLERARGAKGADREGYRAEFIRLVEQAELLDESDESDEPSFEVDVNL